jgi:hypothetical protein
MDRDVLMHRMNERFQELCAQAVDALERAPDGQWIAASEWAFREAFDTLRQETFEAALQAKIEAHPTAAQAAFSPSTPGGAGSTRLAEQRPAGAAGPDRQRGS